MKLAALIFALFSSIAYAHIGATNLNITGQIYLNRVTISKVICLPNGSNLKLTENGQTTATDFAIDYEECRKISSSRSYREASVCSQLEGDVVVAITDGNAGIMQNKHVSQIRSLTIVQRGCR